MNTRMLDYQAHSKLQLLKTIAQRNIDNNQFASIEWQIEKDGDLFDEGSVTRPDLDWQYPQNPIYRIYSMTKPIVALMGVILVERGQLHLSTALADILPEFSKLEVMRLDGSREQAHPIIIEQLFTHRAGFTYNFFPDCPVSSLYREDGLVNDGECSLNDFVSRAAQLPLANQPNERWHYSIATDILARVLEVVSGKPLGALLQHEIFDTLDMPDTQYFISPFERDRLLPMYGRSLDEILNTPEATSELRKIDVANQYPCDRPATFARGGHGLFSTTKDYMRFAQFCLTGHSAMGVPLVSRKMMDFMWANRLPAEQLPYWLGPFPAPGYGFNLFGRIMIDPGQAISLTGLGEGGWGGAASTFFWADRNESFAGVIMTQNLGTLSSMRTDMMAAAYQAIP